MKTLLISGLVLLATVLSSQSQTFNINPEKSQIKWKGSKVIGGGHNGTVNLQEGAITLKDSKIVSGNFIIDMTSIEVLDLSGMKKGMLKGHLSSKDFFHTKKHETAALTIKSVKGNMVTADLTIKGITHPVEFEHTLDLNSDGTLKASANIQIDRTKYDIKYRSDSYFDNLKDKAISDTIEFNVTISGSKAG